ncbi:unnamed protein product [Caenorhabditis auriculariae]|uniref:F-box domain-containing protein n=1 Tax=Caenorhabditis auriculariae TaxID=2777116 RepID=A0A8S1H562_9PELO|nr:unnamed protein product [Caenorhabditis auriculariae]
MSELSGWQCAPTNVLEEIFALLPLKNLGRCSQVCYQWFIASSTDYPWRKFVFKDGVFVRRKYTQHSGWQYHIDHWRLRFLISNASRKWRVLVIEPVTNLFNLYEFFRVLTNFSEYYERNTEEDRPLGKIRQFHFQWRLQVDDEIAGVHRDKDIGTGGEMLHTLSNLLTHLHGLKVLSLIDLQLTFWEGDQFLNDLLAKFSTQLEYLSLLNVSLRPRAFLQPALFLNLRQLVVSPQMIGDDNLSLIACLRRLQTLTIVQDEKCDLVVPCSSKAWQVFTEQNCSRTRLWLILKGKPKCALIIQPCAPVFGIKMEESSGQLTNGIADQISLYYSETLEVFEQCGLERMKRGKKMKERADLALVLLASKCQSLKMLACRERIAHGTALILATFARKKSFQLTLRKNGLLKRVCWSRREVSEMDISFDWLKRHSKNLILVMEEIRRLTSQTRVIIDDKCYKTTLKFREFFRKFFTHIDLVTSLDIKVPRNANFDSFENETNYILSLSPNHPGSVTRKHGRKLRILEKNEFEVTRLSQHFGDKAPPLAVVTIPQKLIFRAFIRKARPREYTSPAR